MDSARKDGARPDSARMAVQRALQEALSHHRSGRWQEARQRYRQALELAPDHPDALHLLGVLHYQCGDADTAVALIRRALDAAPEVAAYHVSLAGALQASSRFDKARSAYQRALELQPDSLDAHLNYGNLLLRQDQLEEAERHYRRALAIQPREAAARSNLGVVLRRRGRCEEAIAQWEAALRERPDYVDALVNLARALQTTERLPEAESAWRRALQRQPGDASLHVGLGELLLRMDRAEEAVAAQQAALRCDARNAQAHYQLGNALFALRRFSEAAAAFEAALQRDPSLAEARNNLGSACRELGRRDAAAAHFREAVRLDPGLASAHYNLGVVFMDEANSQAEAWFEQALAADPEFTPAWKGLAMLAERRGDWEAARKFVERWLELQPDSAEARHVLASYGIGPPSARAPDDYVRSLFDKSAPLFDQRLAELEYRGPELLAARVRREIPAPRGDLRVLDIGCGTGACGVLLRPWAAELTGVDLAPGMLRRAAERQVYDALVEGELTAYLHGEQASFDLIVAADTLNYFGDLEPVLAAAAGALRSGGRFFFTLEAADRERPPRGFQLGRNRRYRHGESYVREALERSGLDAKSIERDELRREASRPVECLLVVAERSTCHRA